MPTSAQSASRLNCAAESGINRIVAMRAPPGPVILPGSRAGARPFLLNKSHLEKNNAALPLAWGKAHGGWRQKVRRLSPDWPVNPRILAPHQKE